MIEMIDVKNCYIYYRYESMCGDLQGAETSVLAAMFEEICGVQKCLYWLPCLLIFGGTYTFYLRHLICRGTVWTIVLATPVELYTYILMRRMRGAESIYVLSSH